MPTLYPGNPNNGNPFPGLAMFDELARGRNFTQIADTLAYLMQRLPFVLSRTVKFAQVSGTINGTNTIFTLTGTYAPNSFWLSVNGLTNEPYAHFRTYYVKSGGVKVEMQPTDTAIPAGALSMEFGFLPGNAPTMNGGSSRVSLAYLQ